MSLSGKIMSMPPGDERSKAEGDLARMADEYESLIDKFGLTMQVSKKKWGLKDFMLWWVN